MRIPKASCSAIICLYLIGVSSTGASAQGTSPDSPGQEPSPLVDRITEVVLYDPDGQMDSKFESILIGLEKVEDETYRVTKVDEIPGVERFAPAKPHDPQLDDSSLYHQEYVWVLSFAGFLEKETHQLYAGDAQSAAQDGLKILGIFDEELSYSPPYTANEVFGAGLLHVGPTNEYFYGVIVYDKVNGKYTSVPMGLPGKETFVETVGQHESGEYHKQVTDLVRKDDDSEMVVNGNTIIRSNPHYPGAAVVEYAGAPPKEEEVDHHVDYYLGYRDTPIGTSADVAMDATHETYEGPGMPGVRVRYRPASVSTAHSSARVRQFRGHVPDPETHSRALGRVYYDNEPRPQPTYYRRRF